MKIESLQEEFADTVQKSAGLRLYLNNLNKGRSATPRSWLYENEAPDDVLASWLSVLETVRKDEHGEEVFQFDTSQLKKWGPQGEVKPISELMELVTAGYKKEGTPKPSLFSSKLWKQAKENAVRHVIVDKGFYKSLRPRALEHVIDDMKARDTLESNSGYPSFTRRNNPFVKARAIRDAQSGKSYEYPAIVLFRNYNQKTRMVWMYPMSMNLVEATFTQPLKEAIMSSSDEFFNAWRGYEAVKRQMSMAYNRGLFISASDFSHTDENFTRWQMLEVFDVIKYAFQPAYWPSLKKSMLHVNSIPLLIGPDSILYGQHGVSSGSNWTNDVETYFDRIAEEYFALLKLVAFPFSAIGDDVAHCRETYLDSLAQDLATLYQQMGFDVNPEKVTNLRDQVKYLQRLMIRGYSSGHIIRRTPGGTREGKLLRGIYSTIRALNSSIYPEKFHSPKQWSKQMFACRQFMILENCVDHPLFDRFVKFVCAGNKYLAEFARLQPSTINKYQRESHLIPGFNPTYNQEKRDKPLSSFASIAIARAC